MFNSTILILGGDKTNYYLYKKLLAINVPVKLAGFNHITGKISSKPIKISGYKTIITPIPLSIDGETLYTPYSDENIYIEKLLLEADKSAQIIGGPFSFKDSRIIDITKNRIFTDQTVIPTCEEIIKTIIEKSDITISGSMIGILGRGRIANRLLEILKLLKGDAIFITKDNLVKCDIIIITNSDNKICDNDLLNVKDNLIIDITNRKYSKELNKNILKARGLPGKSAPASVAEYFLEVLINLDSKNQNCT